MPYPPTLAMSPAAFTIAANSARAERAERPLRGPDRPGQRVADERDVREWQRRCSPHPSDSLRLDQY